ncbi:MAG: copper-binding protein [Planctomycetota bacterium]
MTAHRPILAIVGSAACIGAAVVLSACGESGTQAAPFPEPEQVYSDVRGRVTFLPDGRPTSMPLSIKHEAIPEFVGSDGSVYVNRDGTPGMKAMEMPFPEMAPGVTLDDLEVGEPVLFEFAVAWENASPRYWVTAIEALPMDTELDLPGEAPVGEPTTADEDTGDDEASEP